MRIFLALIAAVLLPSCASMDGGAAGNAKIPSKPKVSNVTVVHKTIVVAAGKTFDGEGKAFKAGKSLGDGSQKEGQDPMFQLEAGATLKNTIIAPPAADGVHIEAAEGKTTRMENVIWTDVGEDAFTVISGNNNSFVEVKKCGFYKADDKVGQVNGTATTTLIDCWAEDFGRFARSNGAYGKGDQKAYRINIDGGNFKDGESVLKMSSPKAVGTISGVKTTNVKEIAASENGAKITVK